MIAVVPLSNRLTDTTHLSWVNALQDRAMDRSKQMPWPSIDLEEYRRTDLSSFPYESYKVEYEETLNEEGRELFSVFPELSVALIHNNKPVYLCNTIDGLHIKLFSQLSTKESAFFDEQFEKDVSNSKDKIAVWNYEKISDGIVVEIDENADVLQPVVIEYHIDAPMGLVVPNIYIRARKCSTATIVVLFKGEKGVVNCVNSVVHSFAEEGAKLTLVKLQNISLESTLFNHEKVLLERDASVINQDIHLGGKLIKSKIESFINGQGSTFDAQGVFFAKDQHFDLNVLLNHGNARGTSKALYKGCVDGRGRTVFQGLIDVAKGAFSTDAYLSNKNLILSNEGRADSIPSLHIANNDVKCSHGSTSGKINQEELFYLQSRGLTKDDARAVIVNGFLSELIENLPGSIKKYVDNLILEKIGTTGTNEEFDSEKWNHG
jgi:Fe-S cluster assembly protein SufD